MVGSPHSNGTPWGIPLMLAVCGVVCCAELDALTLTMTTHHTLAVKTSCHGVGRDMCSGPRALEPRVAVIWPASAAFLASTP